MTRKRATRRTELLAGIAGGLAGAMLVREAVRRARAIDLSGRVAVVTGGSRGLGLLLAEELGRRGARVAICGRDPDALTAAKERLERAGVSVHASSLDVGDPAMAEAFVLDVVDRFGRIDVLVNNAGVIRVGGVEATTARDVDDVLRSNLSGPVHVTFAALPHLRASGREARIVNVTSIGGRVAVPHMLGYAASKFGLVGFSEALRVELDAIPEGPRVVTVTPGLMRTGSFENAEVLAADRDGQRKELDWFAVASSLPVLSIDARTAARRIVRAACDGRPLLRLGLAAHVGDLARRASPGLTQLVSSLVARLLPRARTAPAHAVRGREVASPIRSSVWLRQGMRAASANGEEPRTEPETAPAPDTPSDSAVEPREAAVARVLPTGAR